MNNMDLWDKLKAPPEEAKKKIIGGRLKGMTDIKPQWRFKIVTETFGPVGIGWKYTIEKLWTERTDDAHICAFALVNFYYKQGEWSEAIPGTGGSMLQVQESSKVHTSDEAYKMAVTDALSVCMKALGVGADVYMGYSDSKNPTQGQPQQKPAQAKPKAPEAKVKELLKLIDQIFGDGGALKLKELTTFGDPGNEKWMDMDKLSTYSEKWIDGAIKKVKEAADSEPF